MGETSTVLLCNKLKVGKQFLQALHTTFLTFGGTFKFQKRFQFKSAEGGGTSLFSLSRAW